MIFQRGFFFWHYFDNLGTILADIFIIIGEAMESMK